MNKLELSAVYTEHCAATLPLTVAVIDTGLATQTEAREHGVAALEIRQNHLLHGHVVRLDELVLDQGRGSTPAAADSASEGWS